MRVAEDFTVFPRPRPGKRPVYYYRLRDASGRRTSARSTGQTSEPAARNWVRAELNKGTLGAKKPRTFKEYTASWWRWDECAYVLGRRSRGKRIGQGYVRLNRRFLEMHIVPVLGKKRLDEIATRDVEAWLMALRQKPRREEGEPLTPTSVNHILGCLKTIMREAVRLGDLRADPTATVLPLQEDRKRKGLLEPDEIRVLFDRSRIAEIWSDDLRHYTLSMLAASCGARLGELQALQIASVGEGYLRIDHAWVRQYGLSEPKQGSRRIVPVPTRVIGCLHELMELSPYQEPADLIFWGKSRQTPIPSEQIQDTFYAALVAIGVTEEARRARNVTFHSWRHFANTYLRGKVPDAKLQRITGHRSLRMTDHYTAFRPEDFTDVAQIQEGMLE